MKVDVVMPKMGESLQEGTITKWLKKVGDTVERDEMILEISTDKVDTEVPSPVSGKLANILARENETIEVGKVIAEIETEESAGEYIRGETKEEKAEAKQVEAQKEEYEEEEPEEKVTQPITQETKKPATEKQQSPQKQQKPEENAEEPAEPVAEETRPEAKPSREGMVDVVMPKMGESLQEGTITKWLKQVGDKIERDEMILEISTDKVDTEVPSPVDGTLAEILVGENETVEVGKAIARINTGKSAPSAARPEKAEARREEARIDVPPPSREAGKAEAPLDGEAEEAGEIPRESGKQFFSPVVRNIAESEGIPLRELQSIKGTGMEGRVTKQDVMEYLEKGRKAPAAQKPAPAAKEAAPAPKPESRPAAAQPAPQTAAGAKPIAAPAISQEDEVVPMDRVRQLISEHMSYSWHTSPHVTSVAEADITGIAKFREKHKAEFEKREGIKLTFMPFIAKATVDAIKQFPQINVSVDGKNIIYHKRINLGIATALEGFSLIVPVIKNADALSISGLARSIVDLSTRARSKKLNPDDIQGGTFSITNFGAFNTTFGTPIINQPQVAILGVGTVTKRPVVKNINGEDLIVIRDIVYISITFDHRVVDGMLAGYVLNAIVKGLEGMNESNISL